MRLHENNIVAESHGALAEEKFGISTGDISHVLVILRDKLYSDKKMAVLREYGTNALDAHAEAGCPERPIKVTVPTRLNSFLTIQDFGTGLSEKEIYTVYTQYGKSTKRLSNDAIGQLGLGCKSAFAYTQQFTITSCHEGTKSIYNAYIDSSNVGTMTKLAELPMEDDEETGITITIPINLNDISDFTTKAAECYYYFEPQPEINIKISSPEYIMAEGWWRINANSHVDPVAVMGSIGYPLQRNQLVGISDKARAILAMPIEIRFPIGELGISANREELEYTDVSITNINKRLSAVYDLLDKKVKLMFQKATTQWDAKLLYSKLISNSASSYNRRRLNTEAALGEVVKRNAMWNGIDISKNTIKNTNQINGLTCTMKGRIDNRSYSLKPGTRLNFLAAIVIKDVKSSYLVRAEMLVEQNPNVGTMIFLKSDSKDESERQSQYKQFIDDQEINGIKIYKLSDYQPERIKKDNIIRTSRTKAKVFALSKRRSSYARDNWIEAEASIPNEVAVYVPINRFKSLDIKEEAIRVEMALLKKLGKTEEIKVYGIRVKMVEKLGKGWVPWNTWAKKEFKGIISKQLVQRIVNYNAYRNALHVGLFTNYNSAPLWKSFIESLPKDHKMKAYVEKHKNKYSVDEEYSSLERSQIINRYGKVLSPSYDFERAREEINTIYPMLEHSNIYKTYGPTAETFKAATDYVNLVDRKNNE